MSQSIHRQYARTKPGRIVPLVEEVHPDDEVLVAKLAPVNILTVLECYAELGEYTVVRRTATEPPFRIRTENLAPIRTLHFALAQEVTPVGSPPTEAATIHRIEWHVVRDHVVYYVIRNGRISGRRFLPEELMPVG